MRRLSRHTGGLYVLRLTLGTRGGGGRIFFSGLSASMQNSLYKYASEATVRRRDRLGSQEPDPMMWMARRRQAKLLVSRRHAFFTKKCVSPAGRVCVYSIESHPEHVFFFIFFSSSLAVFFIAKPSSIVALGVQTKWTFNHEGRGHRSLIGVSRGIGAPHRDTLGFSEYKIPYARC